MSLGIIDESTPSWPDGRTVYALAMVVIAHNQVPQLAGNIAANFKRHNPFHWERDKGAVTRHRMVHDVLIASPVHVCVTTALVDSKHQEHTRHDLLRSFLLPMADQLEVDELAVESRNQRDNDRDTREIRNWYRTAGSTCPRISFPDKTDPRTWVADAAAGIWSDVVLGRPGEEWFTTLASHQRITQATWIT